MDGFRRMMLSDVLILRIISLYPTITHHETPHRPQDRLRIQGIARLGGKPQSAGAFPQCHIDQRFNRTDNRSGDSQSLQRQGISGR